MLHPVGTVHVYVEALVTALMLYVWLVRAGHCVVVPVMAPGVAGVAGCIVTTREAAALVPQLLPAVTVMLPFWPALPVVTVIDVVPCPPVMLHPVGMVHVYMEALATALMLYV